MSHSRIARQLTKSVRSKQDSLKNAQFPPVAISTLPPTKSGDGLNVNASELIRAEQIRQLNIEYIPNEEFDLMYAAKLYPKCMEVAAPAPSKFTRFYGKAESLACMTDALTEPLLSFAEEQHEFRRMNFLKFAASHVRETLNVGRPSVETMDQIERLLRESKATRDHIIRSNMRLVISLATKYCTDQYGFEDLVSDGMLTLMEAVEKFDYQRGFRFSTYATHSIRRSFFRKIERKQLDRQRFAITDPDEMLTAEDDSESEYDATADNQLMAQILKNLPEVLTERERHVIEGRYGLNGRKAPQTLVELSNELGICKERVRQVEGNALKKLHSMAVRHGGLSHGHN